MCFPCTALFYLSCGYFSTTQNLPTPWLAILTSPAVWGVVIAHTSNNWGFYTLLTLMPTYFEQALPNINTGKVGAMQMRSL